MEETLRSLLSSRENRGNRPALFGIGRKPLTHAELNQQIERNTHKLNEFGIGRGDRVAIVLPNGADAAICCLSVATCATAAPLNPGSTAAQFRKLLTALHAKALVIEDGSGSESAAIAAEMGICVIRLISERSHSSGVFELRGERKSESRTGFPEPDDVAFVMQTSGSTGEPKLAPLTHRNFCAGARNNVAQFALTSSDRCLGLTPMFYTQGILVSVFSSLIAGGSVVCTPGYDPVAFFEWLNEFHPTWYSAPTAIQRSILSRAPLHPEVIARSRLRLIRCVSAPAGPKLLSEIENLFRAPVLDSYGLTETSSTIAGESLPPAKRKPGSVGRAIGCEIAVVDNSGQMLPADQVGEIVVRGPNVITAYEANPKVNAESFLNGWLRTGDLGRIDPDGYVFLSGRIKELINRGGEKISPQEIDYALNTHPAVAEAVAFAIPDRQLGEEIGAAVVLRSGWKGTPQLETELQELAASRLANRRMPRRVIFVDELPKTATGKTLRMGLAEKLGLIDKAVADEPAEVGLLEGGNTGEDLPRGIIEMLLLHIWESTLGRSPLRTTDDFFELGGDSLLAAQMLFKVADTFDEQLTLADLFQAPNIEKMAMRLAEGGDGGHDFGASRVITVKDSGFLPPLMIPGLHPLFHHLIRRLPDGLPVFGISFPDPSSLSTPFRLEDIAASQVASLRRFRPEGPYALAGWCADGILAFEMAQQLRVQGQEVSFVALIDAFNPVHRRSESQWGARLDRLRYHSSKLLRMDVSAAPYLRERLSTIRRKIGQKAWRLLYRAHLLTDRRIGDRLRMPDQILTASANRYCPARYDGRVLLFRAANRPKGSYADAASGWYSIAKKLDVVDVPGNHRDMFIPPNVEVMAAAFHQVIGSASRPETTFSMAAPR